MDEGWVEGVHVRLRYLEQHGDPRHPQVPSLLLLHGTSSNALYWERLIRHLPANRAIALNLRGHDHSERPREGYRVSDMAADAAQVVGRLGLNQPLVVGHSWGAAVALELAARKPDLIAGVVLIDGPTASLSKLMTWEEAELQMRPPPPVYRTLKEAEAAQAAFLADAWGEDLRPFVHAGLMRTRIGWIPALPEPARLEMLQSLYRVEPEALFPDLRCPVLLVMASDTSDGVAPKVLTWWRGQAGAVVGLCRHAQVKHYESRHDIPLIRPADLSADVERTALAAAFASITKRAIATACAEHVVQNVLTALSSIQADAELALGIPVTQQTDLKPVPAAAELKDAWGRLHGALLQTDLSRPVPTGPHAGRPLKEALELMLAEQRTVIERAVATKS